MGRLESSASLLDPWGSHKPCLEPQDKGWEVLHAEHLAQRLAQMWRLVHAC